MLVTTVQAYYATSLISMFDPLNQEVTSNYVHKSSSYLTGNILSFNYKDKPVNAM